MSLRDDKLQISNNSVVEDNKSNTKESDKAGKQTSR